jgi:hypothetical protein
MIWIVLFLGLNLTSARTVLISADSDPGLHRRLGEWMIQHRAIVREDFLLHTHHGPTLAKEWLGEVLFAAAGRWFGWGGFVLLAATLVATCFWLLHRQLLAERCDVVLATGLVLAAMLACSMHWLARPLLFTHLLTLVFAWQLRWFQLGRVAARRLFALLPPLMILWVNLHGAFMTGLALIAMHALGSAVDARRQVSSRNKSMILAALLLACGAASLANPYGWELHARILGFMRSQELSTVTTEFASPNFHTVGTHGFLLLLFLLTAALMIIRPKLRATDVLLMGGWGYLALFSARNIPIFALVVTPLLAQWLTESMQISPDSWWGSLSRKSPARVSAVRQAIDGVTVVAVVLCVLLVVAKPRIAGGEPMLATDFPPGRYPTAVVDYLRSHPDAVRGEMFNYFLWGGYLEFALPERKPFIDSRNDSYGIGLVREFRIANEPKPGWETVFTKYNVGWTILPVQHPLNRILELSPHWTRVFSNQQALVFSRVS